MGTYRFSLLIVLGVDEFLFFSDFYESIAYLLNNKGQNIAYD